MINNRKKDNYKDSLTALLKIGRSIITDISVDKLLEIITEETRKILNAERCTVFLLDKNTNELWSKIALGMNDEEIRFSATSGLAGYVVNTGKVVNIKDAYNDERFNEEIDKKTGYITKTILCTPMRDLNHEIIGVFQILNKLDNKTFTKRDEDLLVAIGSNAGIAIENASLFKKQQLLYEEQKKSFNSFMDTLAASIDARDKITLGHSQRVTSYTIAIAEQMELSQDDIEILECAALLHDFGKIGIKDSVLCKKGKLTDEEYQHIQQHASITYEILKNMYFMEKFKDVPMIASSHHEKYNGKGYFKGLKGEEIPLGGRILAVADVFDALTSDRHYRCRVPFAQVLDILKTDSWSHFDGNIVNEFFKLNVKQIFQILIPEHNSIISTNDKKILYKITLEMLYKILKKPESDITNKEKNIVSVFEKYYEINK